MPAVTVTLAVYVPVAKLETAELMETVELAGLPGLADPFEGEALIQLAGAEDVSCVETPHESVPDELEMVMFWDGGTCPGAAV